jgi:hypothetical protein
MCDCFDRVQEERKWSDQAMWVVATGRTTDEEEDEEKKKCLCAQSFGRQMALQFVASQPVWRQRSTNEAAGNGFVLFHGKLCRSSVDRCPTSRLFFSLSPRDFFFFGYFFFYSLTDFPPYTTQVPSLLLPSFTIAVDCK